MHIPRVRLTLRWLITLIVVISVLLSVLNTYTSRDYTPSTSSSQRDLPHWKS